MRKVEGVKGADLPEIPRDWWARVELRLAQMARMPPSEAGPVSGEIEGWVLDGVPCLLAMKAEAKKEIKAKWDLARGGPAEISKSMAMRFEVALSWSGAARKGLAAVPGALRMSAPEARAAFEKALSAAVAGMRSDPAFMAAAEAVLLADATPEAGASAPKPRL